MYPALLLRVHGQLRDGKATVRRLDLRGQGEAPLPSRVSDELIEDAFSQSMGQMGQAQRE